MHFVKKTPMTDYQQQAQDRENAENFRVYMKTRNEIFETMKTKKGEFNEKLLDLTRELLERNPDTYTLWNIRREQLQIFREQMQQNKKDEKMEEESKNDSDGQKAEVSDEERLVQRFDAELKLTKECLTNSPKSYSAWNHRLWTFREHPNRDAMGEKELALCEKALGLDCRNFHCWDHRRAVVQLLGVPTEDELAFSDRLIHRNPSNYSAWHYRATLLPKIRPNEKHPELSISEECLSEEMENIKNVCCVNSEDQTAWTYCRWLTELAGGKTSSPSVQNKSSLGSKGQIPVLLSACFIEPQNSRQKALLVFQTPVSMAVVRQCLSLVDVIDDDVKQIKLEPVSQFSCAYPRLQKARIWLVEFLGPPLQSEHLLELKLYGPNSPISVRIDSNKHSYVNGPALKQMFSSEPSYHSEQCKDVLLGLKSMAEELLADGDSVPWEFTALARVGIMLGGYSHEALVQALFNLTKARELDPQRANMYDELADRLVLGVALHQPAFPIQPQQQQEQNLIDGETETPAQNKSQLEALIESSSGSTTGSGGGRLVLKNFKLHSLTLLQPLAGLIEELNLQGNFLGNLRQLAPQFRSFGPRLTHLTLDDNPIEEVPAEFADALPRLQFLSLARTRLASANLLRGFAEHCPPDLGRLILAETPLAADKTEREATSALFRDQDGNVKIRLIFDWLI